MDSLAFPPGMVSWMAWKNRNNKDKVMNTGRAKFYIEPGGAWAQVAIIFMLLSAIFRLIGVWGLWDDSFFRNTQILLPLCCNIIFALCIFMFGRKGFFLSAIPVLMGTAFFIIKALGFDSWLHTLLCILLYLAVAGIYTATVLGFLRSKWLLPPLFALPFLYHVFIEDLAMLYNRENPMSFAYGMQELSVLCIMVSLFCVGMGLKRREAAEPAGKKEQAAVEAAAVTEQEPGTTAEEEITAGEDK